AAMMTFLLIQRALPARPLLSRQRLQLLVALGVMLVAGFLFYLPFYLNFVAPPGGVGVKFATTSLLEVLTVFGALLAPLALFLGLDVGPKLSLGPELRQLLGAALVLVGVVAVVAGNAVFVLMVAMVGAGAVWILATDDSDRRAPLLLALGASIALL